MIAEREIKSNKGCKFPPEVYTHEEVNALIAFASSNARRYPTGARNAALVAFLYRSGLRIAEVLALRPSDVNWKTGEVFVRSGKGRKARRCGVDRKALRFLDKWRRMRRELDLPASAPIFCSLDGKVIDPSYIRQFLPRLGKRAGIDKRVHAHGLRHTLASELLQEGINIGIISRQLGHKSIATTATYLQHICPQQVLGVMYDRDGWGEETKTETEGEAEAENPAEDPAA